MDDLPMSEDTASAYTRLAGVIEKIAPGNGVRDELTSAVMALIDARLADAVELLADRVQEATGVRP